MIVTRTPLRISFAGGGSDFGDFYREHGGAVLSTAIDKYVHVILQQRYDDKIRVGYSVTELADRLDDVRHELVRESMRRVGLERGIEIATMADVPSTGTGLGSSSTVTVGLLNALYAYRGNPQPKETLARDAVAIEVAILKKPIGKQDQYIAAYGGLRKITFEPDDTVRVDSVAVPLDTLRLLDQRLLLFYTGAGRDAAAILGEQKDRVKTNGSALRDMVGMVADMERYLMEGNLDDFGKALDCCWQLKRSLAPAVTNTFIDDLYRTAKGGGGFLLLYCEPSRQKALREALGGLRELGFHLEPDGSKVVFST
jgi:D-glycero-alpha-D-manno-heptose-7-phosphate kinase